jgi:methyl-accepting chemotaxis protein
MSLLSSILPDSRSYIRRFSATVSLMIIATITLSAASIWYSEQVLSESDSTAVTRAFEMTIFALLPYLFSAAVAAITAIAIITMIPMRKLYEPAEAIRGRLKSLANGDLSTKITIKGDNPQMRETAHELNQTIGELGRRIAEWKIINRQQWDLLGAIRNAAKNGHNEQMDILVKQMEKNWMRIAEIEGSLTT